MASSMAMATGAMPDYEHMDERKFRQQLQARNKKAAKNEKRSGEFPQVMLEEHITLPGVLLTPLFPLFPLVEASKAKIPPYSSNGIFGSSILKIG